MDKKRNSFLTELLSGQKEYIYYSIRDLKENSNDIKQGRNGIIAYSKYNVNFKLNPIFTKSELLLDFFSSNLIEHQESLVNIENENCILSDRSCQKIESGVDLIRFGQYIREHPKYGHKLRSSQTECYDILFDKGMNLKPILHYSNKSPNIEIVGFCDDEDLQVDEKESLENIVKSIFSKKSFDK